MIESQSILATSWTGAMNRFYFYVRCSLVTCELAPMSLFLSLSPSRPLSHSILRPRCSTDSSVSVGCPSALDTVCFTGRSRSAHVGHIARLRQLEKISRGNGSSVDRQRYVLQAIPPMRREITARRPSFRYLGV